jgi:MFS transporter, SP family, sugar:H+ symporter
MPWWHKNFSTGFRDANGELNITTLQQAEIVSILSAGTFCGALGAAPFADHIGRRASLILAVIVFSFGVMLQTASTTIPMFVAGRYIYIPLPLDWNLQELANVYLDFSLGLV